MDSQPGPVRDRIAATGRAGIAAITADVETAQRRGEIRADIEARQLAFELHAYAMEANWALAAARRRRRRRAGANGDRRGPWPESAPPRRESNHEICQPY
ncbi:hypothetical protein MRGA423_13440 [Mycobacterium tuberculosis RGTB423]|nr:hypothetical protein MRGA423_13440 [Mycobacterium tuberculosis RGTB423]